MGVRDLRGVSPLLSSIQPAFPPNPELLCVWPSSLPPLSLALPSAPPCPSALGTLPAPPLHLCTAHLSSSEWLLVQDRLF